MKDKPAYKTTVMNFRNSCFLSLLILILFLSGCVVSQKTGLGNLQDNKKSHFDITEKNASQPFFIFISDTQSPMKIETLWLTYTDNDKATGKLFSEIASEKGTDAVFHLGDIVAIGSSSKEWETFDQHLLRLKEAGLPFYPVPGNHEYMNSPEKGIMKFREMFPWLKQTWYTVRSGPVAVVMLNSNFSQLNNEELSEQLQWYKEQLGKFESDPSVRAIIVGTHYSPYTNSKVVSGSTDVQKEILPSFQSCGKCRLFISGHSHAFEHFRELGKDFIVIGGGGGLLQPLRTGDQKWSDLFPEKTEKSFFHYLSCKLGEGGIEVSVKRLKPDQSGFEIPYKITISLKE